MTVVELIRVLNAGVCTGWEPAPGRTRRSVMNRSVVTRSGDPAYVTIGIQRHPDICHGTHDDGFDLRAVAAIRHSTGCVFVGGKWIAPEKPKPKLRSVK